jgi:hypothetical protein
MLTHTPVMNLGMSGRNQIRNSSNIRCPGLSRTYPSTLSMEDIPRKEETLRLLAIQRTEFALPVRVIYFPHFPILQNCLHKPSLDRCDNHLDHCSFVSCASFLFPLRVCINNTNPNNSPGRLYVSYTQS